MADSKTCAGCHRDFEQLPQSHRPRLYCYDCRPIRPTSGRPTTPCGGCGKLLYVGPGSRAVPVCRPCRAARKGTRRQAVPRGTQVRKACAHCGQSFVYTSTSAPRTLCVQCRSSRSRRHYARRSLICEQCGVAFSPTGGHPRKYCSRACFSAWRRAQPSSRDVGRGVRVSDVRSLIWVKDCRVCGSTFTARHSNKVFCSAACKVGDNIATVLAMYHLGVEHGGPGARRWRRNLCELLVERDGPDCGLCHQYVDLSIPSGPRGNDQGPSVDHIHPRSLGGPDTLENVRLTHWGCNRNRGNRWPLNDGEPEHTASSAA